MNPNQKKFINALIGLRGSEALERMCKSDSTVTYLGSRAILAWLNNIISIREEYRGKIPGFPLSMFYLKKNIDNSFGGMVSIDDFSYSFEKGDLLHLAAAIGLGLGIEFGQLNKNIDSNFLKDIGKSLDLLIKVNIITNAKVMKPKSKIVPLNKSASILPLKTIKISKLDINNSCEVCGEQLIKNNTFTGCLCLSALSPEVVVQEEQDNFVFSVSNLSKSEFQDFINILRK